jgi:hypothetical protein
VPKVQVQFHADPREAVSLGLRWARQHDLRAVLEQFFPVYRAVEPSGDDPSATGMEVIDRVALCRADPDLTATTAHEFVSRNPGCLFLSIGSHGDDWLRESALGGVTEEQETLRIWRDLIGKAKSAMHTGATTRNPASGAEETLPRHLHTPGAHELAARGVRILAVAGWNEFKFDDCAHERAPSSDSPGAGTSSAGEHR